MKKRDNIFAAVIILGLVAGGIFYSGRIDTSTKNPQSLNFSEKTKTIKKYISEINYAKKRNPKG